MSDVVNESLDIQIPILVYPSIKIAIAISVTS